MSGTTTSSGPTTKRIIASGGSLARVTMQVRSGPVSSLSMVVPVKRSAHLCHSGRSEAEIRNPSRVPSERPPEDAMGTGFAYGAPE